MTLEKKLSEAPTVPFYKRERPAAMRGTTYKQKTSYGDLYVTINDDEEGKPFEVFATIGKEFWVGASLQNGDEGQSWASF